MVECLVFHSALAGVGKSTIAANVAVCLALQGRRVGVVDANLHDGGLAMFFGLDEPTPGTTLNDFLLERCDGMAAFYDVTPPEVRNGQILLLPSSPNPRDLTSLIEEGFRIERMTDDLLRVATILGLEVLILDTQAGLQSQPQLTMLTVAMAQTLVIMLRLDQRDYQRTSVSLDVAHSLRVRQIALLANQIATSYHLPDVKANLEAVYDSRVAALIPYTAELAALASADLFVLRYPDHPVAQQIEQLATILLQANSTALFS